MTTLTKEQRHEAYKLGLSRLLNYKSKGSPYFFCTDMVPATNIVLDEYPELLAKKPKIMNSKNTWFCSLDFDSRENILTTCIEETK